MGGESIVPMCMTGWASAVQERLGSGNTPLACDSGGVVVSLLSGSSHLSRESALGLLVYR